MEMGKEHYHALVDMGSNGIRLSISDLSTLRARTLPTIYQDRCDISLYDAQHKSTERVPIPQDIIDDIVGVLRHFVQICEDFELPKKNIRIVATEATRTAPNSTDFLDQIYSRIGFKVDLLAKEEEGRIGALGIASSFSRVKGLVMDLGGGSMQLTWLETDDGTVKTGSKGSVSLPYGAAALMKELERVKDDEAERALEEEISAKISKVFQELELSQKIQQQDRVRPKLDIFLSGGGFRGWGYILMSKHAIQPYPMPIINGFSIDSRQLSNVNVSSLSEVDNSTFRISSRRASQVPAISLLISALTRALPAPLESYTVHFAQGGVREGLLFSLLPSSVRSLDPLIAATSPFAPKDTPVLLSLVKAAFPAEAALSPSTSPFADALLVCAIHLFLIHASHPKDIRASSALRCTTTGILADAHGINHFDRAILALTLCERWRAEVPPTDHDFRTALQRLVGAHATFWAAYFGRILHGLGDLFPAGVIRKGVLQLDSAWGVKEGGKKGRQPVLRVEIRCNESYSRQVADWARDVEKLGKRKNWARDGPSDVSEGFKIQCNVEKMPIPG